MIIIAFINFDPNIEISLTFTLLFAFFDVHNIHEKYFIGSENW